MLRDLEVTEWPGAGTNDRFRPVTAKTERAEWRASTVAVVKNVVSIHFHHIESSDTSPAPASEVIGLVLDTAKGYILMNRHVVGSGPFWGYCGFDNHGEIGHR